MNPDRWNQIQTLFKEVVELDHNSRETRLNQIFETDTDLYNELSSLLAADAEPSGLLDGFTIDSLDISELLSMDGIRIGPFEIDHQIGSGGMGNVYLGRRVSGGFKQKVALKLIKQGMSSGQILHRFENERSILARLQHPDIARLIDGGLTDDGMPWFAMEYVKGEPIDAFCSRLNLSVEERLRLFQRIAEAVQYAHRNLVVHRDLKPANILVSVENGSPQVRLLDFGIARLLDDDDANPFLTQEGIRPMTRAYASPEQLTGEPVTTASDIYSLGVVLYELLSGHLPFQPDNLTSKEFEQLILAGDPPRPSQACTDPQRRNLICGDLDMICMKALRLEPDRRYTTTEQFSEDIRRYLTDLPVFAQPESRGYLLKKFVNRHRTAVVATGLVMLSLVMGVIAFAWQYRVASAERDHARQEAATSREVAGFLQSLFEVADPAVTNGDTLTARELLDRGAKQINRKLAGQPQVQARMFDVLGNVYLNLWRYNKADTMFSRALDIRRKVEKDENSDLATSLYNIGRASIGIGAYPRADSVLSRALLLRRNEVGENDTLTGEVLVSLGLLKYKTGHYNLSQKYYQQALAIYQRSSETEQGKYVAQIKNDLGLVYYSKGEYDLSATFIKQGLDYYMNHPDSNREIISTDLGNLATTLTKMARYSEADSLFRESIKITKRLYGDNHPNTALQLNNYSTFLKNRERYAEAEKYQKDAMDIFLKAYGPNHPYVAMCYNNMANLYDDQGDYKAALKYDKKSLVLNRKIYGENNDLVANSLNNIGAVLLDLYRNKDAEEMFRGALRIDTIAFGNIHPYVAMDYQSIGIALGAEGKVNEAERFLRYSISVYRKSEGNDNPETEIAKGELGRVLIKKGQYDEAMKLLRDVLAHQEKSMPKDSWRMADGKSLLGECLFRTGHAKEAEPLLTEGYRILLEKKGKNYRLTRGARERLVAYYRAIGQLAKADEYRK
ncbi:MAG TPA: serine/threonine-protein kinase [Balneolales bacterium]|nr:serine/threonine-protein kinase [Balneolales bacterium]